jgi:hypothetical protein
MNLLIEPLTGVLVRVNYCYPSFALVRAHVPREAVFSK